MYFLGNYKNEEDQMKNNGAWEVGSRVWPKIKLI